MAVDYVALKSEIQNDPAAMGYPDLNVTSNDPIIADIGNNANGDKPRTVNNQSIETGDVRGSITFDAFDGLTVAEQGWFEWLSQNGTIPVNDHLLQSLAGIPSANGSIWAAADRNEANAAMAALMQRTGSRAEELKDTIGKSFWTSSDIANARNA